MVIRRQGLMVFLWLFFQVCWDVIKANIMGVLHDFSKFKKSFNATFIALILKKSGAIGLNKHNAY
jgi:hypothetical protein